MLGSTIMIVIFNIPGQMMQPNYYSENLVQNTPAIRAEQPCLPSSTSDNKCEKK